MGDGKPDTIDAATKVIVLAFDLAESTLADSPTLIAKALQSPPVQDAIKKTLLDFAKTKVKAAPTAVVETPEEGRKLLEALGEGVIDKGSRNVLDQIKKTHQYKSLEASVNTFKKTAASSNFGVWVDKHKGILYVVGVALIGGTAGVLYYTRTSGTVVNKALDLVEGKQFEVLQIGTLTFKAELWDFQPDARILGAKVLTTKKWESVTLDLKLGLLAEGSQLQLVEGAAVVKSGAFSVSLTGAAKPQVQEVNLGLSLEHKGVFDNGTLKVGLGAVYKDDQLSGNLNAALKSGKTAVGVQGNLGPKNTGGVQGGVLLTLSVDL
jgi:hypothetical protein